MTDEEIRQLVRDEVSRAFRLHKVEVDGVNIPLDSILKSKHYRAAVATNSKLSHEDHVNAGKQGGRGNRKVKP